MVGLVITSHGRLAEELLSTARQIVGEVPQAVACSIEPGTAPEVIRARVREAVRATDAGDGVIVLADLLGGTPCNQSLSLCSQAQVEVISGANLPMLIKANSLRVSVPVLRELAAQLTQYGQRSITCASELLRSHEPVQAH